MFSFLSKWQQPHYSALLHASEPKDTVHDDDSLCDSETQLLTIPLSPPRASSSHVSKLWCVVPWLLSFLFAVSSVFLWLQLQRTASFGGGYSTDFAPARKAIELQQVTFTGGPAYREDGSFYVPNPGDVDYIGDPSPAVDEAWERLITGRYIIITEAEAKQTWPDTYKEYYHPKRKGYVVGTDMFHTLHCLNNLRKSFHPSYYPNKGYDTHKVHMNHCLDQLRQYVMCAGDMTPIPTKYYPGKGRNYVLSDVPHTCRNFEALREWQTGRFVGGAEEVLPDGAVEPWRAGDGALELDGVERS